MEEEISKDINLKRNLNKYVRKIIGNIEERKNVKEALNAYITLLNMVSVPKDTSRLVIQKIQSILLIEWDKELMKVWSEIVKIHRDTSILDVYVDFSLGMKERHECIDEIIKLKDTFGVYYFKFLREFKTIEGMEEMTMSMENEYRKYIKVLSVELDEEG
jgi:hypothetical protein